MPALRGRRASDSPAQPAPKSSPTTANSGERRALLESAGVTVVFVVGAILWGLISQSRVIIFDGVYGALALILTGMSMRVSSLVASGPTARYPFGRSALMPMSIVVQGAALGAVLAYAATDAVLVIRDGGAPISTVNVVVYGSVAAALSMLTVWRIRRLAPTSDLAKAEILQWQSGAVLSAVITVGALGGLVAINLDYTQVIPYVDPALVLLACVILVPVPVRMIASSLAELLEAGATPEVLATIESAVAQVGQGRQLEVTGIRATKLGPRLYVDIDARVEPGTWDVADVDAYTDDIEAALDVLDFDVWPAVAVTTKASPGRS